MRILDVGCGRGGLTNLLARRGATVVGMDISRDFIREARDASSDNCDYLLANASTWCFKKGSFDMIHCHHTLEHLADLDQALDGIAEALTPGGQLYLSFPCRFLERILGNLVDGYFGESMHRRIIGPRELIDQLASRGVKVTSVKKRKLFDALSLVYSAVRGFPLEPQSGQIEHEDFLLRLLRTFSKWSFLDPEEVDFGKKKYLKGILILAKAEERVFRHLFPHEYYMEALKT